MQETKTVVFSYFNEKELTKKIENEAKLGWELAGTVNNPNAASRISPRVVGTVIIRPETATLMFKRSTDIPFYERKKELGEHIDELSKIVDDYNSRGLEREIRRDNYGIANTILGSVAVIAFIVTLALFASNNLIGIAVLVGSIALGILWFFFKRKLKHPEKSEEHKTYEETLRKIQSYYDEAAKLR